MIVRDPTYCVVRSIRLTFQFPPIAVTYILLRHFIAPHLHDASLYHILNVFYIHSMRQLPYLDLSKIVNAVKAANGEVDRIHQMNDYQIVAIGDVT